MERGDIYQYGQGVCSKAIEDFPNVVRGIIEDIELEC